MKKLVTLLAFLPLLSFASCTDDPRAEHVLRGAGYSDIHLTGYAWTGCSDKDSIHNEFWAKGPTGVRVDGVVCCGWGLWSKACTIRIEE